MFLWFPSACSMESFFFRRSIYSVRRALYKFDRLYAALHSCSGCFETLRIQKPSLKPGIEPPYDRSFIKNRCISNRGFCFAAADTSASSNRNVVRWNPEDEEAIELVNDFLERFVAIMRLKLSEAYPDASADVIHQMLVLVVERVVLEIEKGTFVGLKSFEAFAETLAQGDFSKDLWMLVWEVSKLILEDIRKTEVKREIQEYLQSDEMKQITKFAKDVGITGELMRELKMDLAEEKKAEVEFYGHLNRMAGKDRLSNLFKIGGKILKVEKPWLKEGPEEGHGSSLPHRSAKLKFQVNGMDLSDASWFDIGEKIDEAERMIIAVGPADLSGKIKLVVGQIQQLSDDEDPTDLLCQLSQDGKFSRAEWLAVVHKLNVPEKKNLHLKAREFVLDQDSFGASIRDYTRLLDVYGKEGHVSDAERLLEKMELKGLEQDSVTCNILINMYSNSGHLRKARAAFDQIRALGLQPGQEVYNSIIMAYVKAGFPRAAETLLREMDAKDLKPDNEVYMALLKAFADKGLADGAQWVYDNMQFAGIMPTLESCTLLVQAYEQAGDPDQARNVFDFMMESGHRPDDRCLARMLAAYERKNLFDKAIILLSDLESKDLKPGVESSTVLIDWFAKLGLLDEAEHVVDETFHKGEVPLKVSISLCDAYARAKLPQKTSNLLRSIEEKVDSLKFEDFEKLIHGFLAGELIHDAIKMYECMQSRGFVPSNPIKSALAAAQHILNRKPTGRK